MAYDRYDTRREGRDPNARWRDDDRERGPSDRDRGWSERDRGRGDDDRGWFERAGEQIASWFGDDDDDRQGRRPDAGQFRNQDDVDRYYAQRDRGPREPERRGWFGGSPERGRGSGFGRDENRERGGWASHDEDRGRTYGRRDRAFMSDEDFSRYERSPRWRDEGYRRPYTGRFSGRQDFGPEQSEGPYRPMTGDYGRGMDERLESGGNYYGVSGGHRDPHYDDWRRRQLEELDRDYEDYRREHQSRFESDFGSWRERRQSKRQLLGQIREHFEVLGSDGEHIGTVDRVAGDRIILTKSDPDAGGAHHSLMCTSIDRVEGDKVFLETTAEKARESWRDESRHRALFEREDQGEAGPGMLNRSFSGTY